MLEFLYDLFEEIYNFLFLIWFIKWFIMHFFDDIYLSTLGEHYIDSEGHEETDMLARLVGRQPISLGLGRGHSCALCWNL